MYCPTFQLHQDAYCTRGEEVGEKKEDCTQNLLVLHYGRVCPHSLMDRIVLSRMAHIEEFGILVMLGVGHDEATESEGAGLLMRWCGDGYGSQLRV